MYVLVACEESQRVCTEFRKLGHNAFSCDLIPCSGGHPEWHIKGDALEAIEYEERVLAHTTKERQWMQEQLRNYGFRVMDSVANFLFFEAEPGGRMNLGKWLLERDIEICPCDKYRNASEDYYRVAINTHENNVRLIEAIGGWLK